MCRPTSSLALVRELRSRSKRPANGLSRIAATATLRSGGLTACPASTAVSSTNVSVRLICMPALPQTSQLYGFDNYLTDKAFQACYYPSHESDGQEKGSRAG